MKRLANRLLRGGYHFFTRLDWSAVLLFIILLWIAVGSWFPQRTPEIGADPGRLAFWEAEVRARYKGLTEILKGLGVFHWYRSPLFKVILGWLALATLVCTLNRWRGLWRRAFWKSGRVVAVGSCEATLILSEIIVPWDKLCEILRQYGFRSRLVEVQGKKYVRGDRNRFVILATLLTHLAVLFLLFGAGLSYVYAWREELTLRPGSVVALEHRETLAYRHDGFEVLRRPDGSVLNYEAAITILRQETESKRGIVRVNTPLVYKGLRAYLRSYVGGEGHYILTFWVTRDPGYPLVIGGGFLLFIGMTLAFNFPHVWVQAQVVDGALSITGGLGRSARWRADGDFARMFTALVGSMQHLVSEAADGRRSTSAEGRMAC
jgi:cytochrome c biogenesis protein ResB